MTSLPIDTWARELEDESPRAILRWAADHFAPDLTMASAFLAEDCLLIDIVARAQLPIDVFTLDTGLLFAETLALRETLQARYDLHIRAVEPEQTVAEQARTFGESLWLRAPGRCCDLRKTQPLERALAGKRAWITGIRREQTPERANAKVVEWDARHGLVKINPLVRWKQEDVWTYVHANAVPYNPLHEKGYPSIGCRPCTSPVAIGEDPRSGRWRGSEKRECGIHFEVNKDEGPQS